MKSRSPVIMSIILTILTTVISQFDNYVGLGNLLHESGVRFDLWLRDISVQVIPGTLVYLFQMSMTGVGC